MSEPAPDRRRLPIWVTYGVLAIGLITFSMGQTILFTVLGPLAREIGLSEIQVGLMISLAAIIIAVASPWWGRRSDLWGRRMVMVFGLMSYALTMVAFVFVIHVGLQGTLAAGTVFLLMIGVRSVYAVLTAGIQPAATAYIADTTTGADRAAGLALVGAAYGLGSVLGPAFGSAFSVFGLLTPLNGVALLAFVGAVAVLLVLPPGRRLPRTERGPVLSWRDNRIMPFLLIMSGVLTVGASAQQTAAFYLQDLFDLEARETARYVGIIMAVSALALLIAQGGIVQMLKPRPGILVRSGLALSCIGFLLLVVAASFEWILMGYVLLGFAMGLVNPGLLAAVSLNVQDKEQGAVAGLMGSAMASGFVVGPVLGTWLYGFAPERPFQISAVILVVLFAFSWLINFQKPGRRQRRSRVKNPSRRSRHD